MTGGADYFTGYETLVGGRHALGTRPGSYPKRFRFHVF